MLELDTDFGVVKIHPIDENNEIHIETLHDNRWINVEQAKQLIDFLQKQIEGK